eukprot:m.281016 g.281016  ORF g.281016 m.281016 type:complete len:108 (+) comp16171_c0_seq3:6588-6911(+)
MGIAADSSAIESDPKRVTRPQIDHTIKVAPGDLTSATTKPGLAKMPLPMTIPTMSPTALRRVNVLSMPARRCPRLHSWTPLSVSGKPAALDTRHYENCDADPPSPIS